MHTKHYFPFFNERVSKEFQHFIMTNSLQRIILWYPPCHWILSHAASFHWSVYDCWFVCVCVRTASASLTAGVCHVFCTPMPNYRSKYSSLLYHVQTVFLKHEDQNKHLHLKYTYTHLDCHIRTYTHTQKSESIHSSVNSWIPGKARNNWNALRVISNIQTAISFWPFGHEASLDCKGKHFFLDIWEWLFFMVLAASTVFVSVTHFLSISQSQKMQSWRLIWLLIVYSALSGQGMGQRGQMSQLCNRHGG